jgi:alpha/beta superfamily hydrolase
VRLNPSPYQEFPVFFPAGREHVFGILTYPARTAVEGVAAVLLTGGGLIPGSHRNGMWVALARSLAAQGIPALRFDYRGVGESTGIVPELWLDRPFTDDLVGAARWLRERGMTRLALAGSCFGARTILGASEQLEDLAGAVLLSVPLRGHREREYAATRFAQELTLADYMRRAARLRVIRRLLDGRWRAAYMRVLKVKARRLRGQMRASLPAVGIPRAPEWVSPVFLEPFVDLVRRGVPTLLLYGSEDEYYHEFRRAVAEGIGVLLEGRDVIEVRTVNGVLHGFTTVGMQRAAIEQTLAWIVARVAPAVAASPSAAG